MQWVDSCKSNEVLIESSYIHGLKVWRELNYYINPLSEANLELGTLAFPYKNTNLAFIELFNFVSDTDQAVTIRVANNADHEIAYNVIIKGISNLVIETYNPTNGKTSSGKDFVFTSK
jgi:hypothetical protein